MPSRASQQNKVVSSASTTQSPTRERILAYLYENRIASVQELSRAWGLTRADIRYHFNSLVAEGSLEQAPRDPHQPARRGRPEQYYRLASASAMGNLMPLCSALLEAYLAGLPVEQHDQALRALAAKLAGKETPAPNLTQRFNQASAFLSQRGYQARWEAYASGPRILLRRCPYAALLPTYPVLCSLDRLLLEQLVRVPLQQTTRINLTGNKPAACVFNTREES